MNTKKQKILVVEDSRTYAKYISDILEAGNYETSVAVRGEEAVDLVATINFNLVLLDMELPGISGLEVLEIIRKTYNTHQLPIIFISATTDINKISMALELGANDFLEKPFKEIILQIKIKNLLLLQQTYVELEQVNKINKLQIAQLNQITDELHFKSTKLSESEERNTAVFEKSLNPIMITNNSGFIVYYNSAACKMLNYTAEEFSKLHVSDIDINDSPEKIAERIALIQQNGTAVFESTHKTKTGKALSVIVNLALITLKNEKHILGTVYDITPIKQKEKELELLSKRLNEAQQLSNIGNWELDIANNKLFWSDEIYRIFGTEPNEFEATYEAFLRYIHPDDRDLVNQAFSHSLQTKTSYEVEHRVVTKSGAIKFVIEKGETEYDNLGNPVVSRGIVQDITANKKSAIALKESEEKFKNLIQNQGEGVAISDLTGNLLFANPAAEHIFGVGGRQLEGKNLKEFVSDEQWQIVLKNQASEEKCTYEIELTQSSEKKVVLLATTTPQFDFNKKRTGTLSIFRDITEQKIFTKKLETLNKIHHALLSITDEQKLLDEFSNIVVSYSDSPLVWVGYKVYNEAKDVKVMSCSGEAIKYLDSIKTSWADDVYGSGPTGMSIKTGEIQVFEIEEDAFRTWKETAQQYGFKSVCFVPIKIKVNQAQDIEIIGAFGIYSQHTQTFKNKEEQKFLQSITEDFAIGIEKIRTLKKKKEALATIQLQNDELTSREEELKAALENSSVLLQEVHHRVKNNLQIIKSLLFQQQHTSDNPLVKSVLQDSMDRVASISLVHEQIYRSKDFENIDFNEYINIFSKQLLNTYRHPDTAIHLSVNVDKISIKLDNAVPVALILNELMSNSLKYAFRNRKEGKIEINLSRNADGLVRLVVSDDGIGFPKDYDFEKSKSLGMFIVKNIVTRQLRGELKTNTSPEKGTEFILTFNLL